MQDTLEHEDGIEPASEKKSLEERLGTAGVILLAVLAAAICLGLMNVLMPSRSAAGRPRHHEAFPRSWCLASETAAAPSQDRLAATPQGGRAA